MDIQQLGWNKELQAHFESQQGPGQIAARVAREDRESYVVYGAGRAMRAAVSGAFRYRAVTRADFPAVGDWVTVQPRDGETAATIHAVLQRKSVVSRKAAGTRVEEQVVAANIDLLFVCCGLDLDFNLRRMERYLTLARACRVTPVVALTKADACDCVEERLAATQALAGDARVLALSSVDGRGLADVRGLLQPGVTVALVGSSGVGKSSLINALLGEARLKTQSVREGDGRGRHTTTYRELLPLPNGGVIIDTPGMRELQALADDDDLGAAFSDIDALAAECRFADCKHEHEPGCQVLAAIEAGELDSRRLDSYRKQKRELSYLERRDDLAAQAAVKEKWKRIHKAAQKWYKQKYRL